MAAVLPAWIKKYGEEKANEMWQDYKKRCSRTSEYYEKKYGKEYADILKKKKISYSLESCIERYGKELGEKKWNERLSKKLKSQEENFKEKKWKNGRTLEEYQIRYGVKDGYKRWKKRNERQSYMVSKQRYLDDYGDDGVEMCRSIKDTTSIEAFIKRYGHDKGSEEYDKYIELRKKTSPRCKNYWIKYHDGDEELAKQSLRNYHKRDLEFFIDRYGESLGKTKHLEFINKTTSHNKYYSKMSQDLFWQLYKELNLTEQDTKFFELNEEQLFYNSNNIIKVDFKYKNNIIEFNGDYWHANPKIYKKDDFINGKIAEDTWKKDNSRYEFLKSVGYNVIVIWENEWKTDKDSVLNKCKKFLLNE